MKTFWYMGVKYVAYFQQRFEHGAIMRYLDWVEDSWGEDVTYYMGDIALEEIAEVH